MKIYVAVPTPTFGSVLSRLASWLLRLPNHIKPGDLVIDLYEESNIQAVIRNHIARRFLATDCDVLWMVDSDMDPSVPGLPDGGVAYFTEALAQDDVDMVSGISFRLGENGAPVPCVSSDKGKWHVHARVFDREPGLIHEPGLSTGGACLAIKRKVLEAFFDAGEPPFIHTFVTDDPDKLGDTLQSEDTYFIRTAQDKGFSFWLDTRVQWGHVKRTDVRDELRRTQALMQEVENGRN